MDRVAGSFGFPFRKGAGPTWLIGLVLLLLGPIGAIPLLGYTVAIVRQAAADPDAGPPRWGQPLRLLREGLLLAVVIGVLTLPFSLLAGYLSPPFRSLLQPVVADPFIRGALGTMLAISVSGLPWGILLLVLMPPATARFARSGSVRDLLDVPAALGLLRRRFGDWNLVVVAIVTAWAIGAAGLGLALIGVLPGILYAVLVSAHATGALVDA